MGDEWLERLRRVTDRDRWVTDWAFRDLAAAQGELAAATKKLHTIEKRLRDREERLRSGLADLMEMRNDPIVLVRNYGAYRDVYHSADHPCGHVGHHRGYDRVLWGVARAEGKRPCTACGYRADSDAQRVRPKSDEEDGRKTA